MSHELHCSKRDVRRKHGRFDNGEILDGLQNIISTFCDEQGALRLKMQAEDDSLLKSYESRILHVETDFGQRIESCKAQQQLLVSALDTSQASLKSLQREIGNIEESIVMCIEAEAELEQGRSNEATMERQKYECIKQDILKERSQKDLILSNRLIEAFGHHLQPEYTEQGYRKRRCTESIGTPKSPDTITNDDGLVSDTEYISFEDV